MALGAIGIDPGSHPRLNRGGRFGHRDGMQVGRDIRLLEAGIQHAQMVDDLARRKNLQGPSAGLGDVQVVVDPVQRT